MVAARSGKHLKGWHLDSAHLKRWVFPAAMLGVGAVAAAIVASLPQDRLDLLSWRLWLPSILPAATPPVGLTGRILLAIATLALFTEIGVLPLLWRLRARRPVRTPAPAAEETMLPWLVELPATKTPEPARAPDIAATPSSTNRLAKLFARPAPDTTAQAVRRADSHPDAPPRRPIMATEDLGPPLPIAATLDVRPVPEPERPLPADLDQPLAAFDPHAVPDVPREPVRAVAPLVAVQADPVPARPATIDPGERFETFAIPAPVAAVKPAAEPPEPEPAPIAESRPARAPGESLAALLDRLERGAGFRAAPEPARAASLNETLVQLRRLATG